MKNNSKKRIVYIDLMRAFAVIMMIQGHTTDTFLADDYRSTESLLYNIWLTMRGFTAPIFMFTAGEIFTYLLRINNFDFLSNPRVKKGIKRGLTLIAIGYLLRYPTYRIFDFTYVNQNQWNIFFAVDALHLIGFGLLFIILFAFFAKRAHLNFNGILVFAILFLLAFSPLISKIDWDIYLPSYLSAYLCNKNGSLFPFTPWLIYVFAGALLGNYLYKNEGVYFKKRFSFSLTSIGTVLIAISIFMYSIKTIFSIEIQNWLNANMLIFIRLGYVFIANGIMAFFARNYNNIPKLITDTGKNTLLLYVIHIIILYGCAWFPGLNKYYGKTFSGWQTLTAAAIMLILMLAVVIFIEKIKTYRKNRLFLKNVNTA